jgi:outer membrane cobalamin receptor
VEPGGTVITRAEIETYDVRNAFEVILRARTHLNIQHVGEGSEPRVTHRGVDSIVLSPQVLFVVDGTRVSSVDHLRNIPVESLAHIQILSAREATPRFGTSGGNGAILVWTTAS